MRTLLILLLIWSGAAFAATAPVARTGGGAVTGVRSAGVDVFRGIRYAAAPIGPLRWMPPVAPPPWRGVRKAQAFGPDCMQARTANGDRPMSEDCLFLNVWRPTGLRPGARLPVMVWIHGGGLVLGSAAQPVYDGSAFARRGIVFVSLNYRLGRLGFFAFPALSRAAGAGAPLGNYGYMDQMAALAWVRRNIDAFGGDPQAVTVFGESSGGGSVVTLLTSPRATGLFDRAMVMSGGGRWAPPILRYLDRTSPSGVASAEAIGINFAISVGIDGNGAAALRALRMLPAKQIVARQTLMTATGAGDTHVGRSFVDGVVMPEPQDRTIAGGGIARVPLVAGTTAGDIGFFTERMLDEVYASFGSDAATAQRRYDPAGTGAFRQIATDVARDRNMTEPARFLVRAATAAGMPAFYYRFSYVPAAMQAAWPQGTPHGGELPFVFDTLDTAPYAARLTPADRAVARDTNRLWADFAKGKAPWPSHASAPHAVMDIGARATMQEDPWRSRLDLVEDHATYHLGAAAR